MRTRFLITLIFGLAFLLIDTQTYYYGIGKGFLATKISPTLKIKFGGSDLGNTGPIIEENDVSGVYLIAKGSDISTKPNNDFIVSKFKSYYFKENQLIAEVVNESNITKYISIVPIQSNNEYPNYTIEEVLLRDFKTTDYKYVNLDYSIQYFKKLKSLRYVIVICFILTIANIIYYWYVNRN
ncbi:hypothetical protein [Vaginella massiliensis]|uniref:hypothetical protein n=1 Tax=Vaginella massiliensis TaxID=1816680 RepID=UPI00083859C0|nr:hypothetical protein [Vaginella massiliensis]